MTNPWIIHVKKYHSDHPNMIYKDVLKEAAKTYTKIAKKNMKGRGIVTDVLGDIKEGKLVSKATDYISNKVKQSGYGHKQKKTIRL